MAIKENINAIKQEITTEEQFLEGMIKGERFVKKYKNAIIGTVVVLVLAGVGYAGLDVYQNKQRIVSNEAYDALVANPSDTKALETLKNSSTILYETYLAKLALNSGNKAELEALLASNADPLLKELASYELNQKADELLTNLVILQNAHSFLLDNKIEEAKVELSLIPEQSPLYQVAKNLEHYQGK